MHFLLFIRADSIWYLSPKSFGILDITSNNKLLASSQAKFQVDWNFGSSVDQFPSLVGAFLSMLTFLNRPGNLRHGISTLGIF